MFKFSLSASYDPKEHKYNVDVDADCGDKDIPNAASEFSKLFNNDTLDINFLAKKIKEYLTGKE